MEIYDTYREVISESILFRNMTPEEIMACISGASPEIISLEKRETLPLPEKLRDIYFVLSGRLNVVQDNGMITSLVHALTPGRCFGIAFCAEDIPCSHALYAVERCSLLRLRYRGLLAREELRVRVTENLLAITSQNLRVLAEKIAHTKARSVRVKLSVFLRDQMAHKGGSSFEMDMNRNDMAEYLNITYPAMLRELSQMQKEGILVIEGDRITILNENELIEKGSE